MESGWQVCGPEKWLKFKSKVPFKSVFGHGIFHNKLGEGVRDSVSKYHTNQSIGLKDIGKC